MKRQAMQVSIKELEDMIKSLKKERLALKRETGILYPDDKKFIRQRFFSNDNKLKKSMFWDLLSFYIRFIKRN